MEKEDSLRRKHGIHTARSEHECQWRWPSCLPNALALISCGMQLYVCVLNSLDANKQRRASAHGLAARLVYVFRGVSEGERRSKKDTGQTASSAEYRNARCMQQRRLSDMCLLKCLFRL